MPWIRQANFTGVQGVKWIPEVSEYDIDGATDGKFKQWLVGSDADAAVRAPLME